MISSKICLGWCSFPKIDGAFAPSAPPLRRPCVEKIADKNPADNFGRTPLHEAAKEGHLDICRLIIENVDNKHPVDQMGRTPKFSALKNKYVAVAQLFKS